MSQAVNFKFGQLLYDRWMTNFNKYKDAFIHNTESQNYFQEKEKLMHNYQYFNGILLKKIIR